MARRKSVTLLLLVVMTLVALAVGFFTLRIKSLECDLDGNPCPSEILVAFDSIKGQSLLFFNDQQLQALLESYPAYQLNEYGLWLPGTLRLTLAPQTIMYTLSSEIPVESFAVTSEGKLIANTQQTQVPQVLLSQNDWIDVQEKQQLQPALHAIFTQTLNDLQAAKISVPVLYLHDPQTLVLELPDQPLIVFDPQQPTANVARLKHVLDQLSSNPDSALIQEVDVRYKLPVLRQSTSIPRHTSY